MLGCDGIERSSFSLGFPKMWFVVIHIFKDVVLGPRSSKLISPGFSKERTKAGAPLSVCTFANWPIQPDVKECTLDRLFFKGENVC